MPAYIIPSASDKAKLSKIVDGYVKDPESMLNLANKGHPVPEYAQSFASSAARAVNYLSAMKPKTAPMSPLDSKVVVSQADKAKYDNALAIAQQPLSILTRIKSGTLTTQDMETIRTVHPAVYKVLAQKITANVIEAANRGDVVPYKTRIMLSQFLGQPLDSTLKPQAIHSIQAQGAAQQQQKDAQQQQRAPSASSTKGLKKMGEAAQTSEQSKAAGRMKRNN